MSKESSYEELETRVNQLTEQNRAFARMEEILKKTTEERLRFERLLTELSAAFVKIPVDEVDEKVEAVLENIGEILGVDRTDFAQLVTKTGQVEITQFEVQISSFIFPVE